MELLHTDTLEEAREKLWKETREMDMKTRKVKAQETPGRISASDVVSDENIPPFDRSVVDGYAVRARETYGAGEASPVFFRVTGQVRSEEAAGTLSGCQEAVRLQTGSMIPDGADAVVMSEYTEEYAPGRIACIRAVSEGENIIRAGEDVRRGECIIRRGQKIGVGEAGMLAGLGIREIQVYLRPSVAILSTGDELAGGDEPLTAGRIRDINTSALSAAALEYGMEICLRRRIRDEEREIRQAVEEAAEKSDIVLISGGSSKGDKDFTKRVLEEITGNVFTHGIAVRPGKPTILAYDRERRAVIAGLPGHPMAAVIMFRLLIRDWYRRKTGSPEPLKIPAVMKENVSSNQVRATCLPVRLVPGADGYEAVPVYAKSGSISALAKADAFIMIPRNREGLRKGEKVKAELL